MERVKVTRARGEDRREERRYGWFGFKHALIDVRREKMLRSSLEREYVHRSSVQYIGVWYGTVWYGTVGWHELNIIALHHTAFRFMNVTVAVGSDDEPDTTATCHIMPCDTNNGR